VQHDSGRQRIRDRWYDAVLSSSVTRRVTAPIIYVFRRQYGDYAARIPDLPGCGANAATKEEAVAAARETAREYLSSAVDTSGRLARLKEIDVASFPVDDTNDGAFLPEDAVAFESADITDAAAQFAYWSTEIARLTAAATAAQAEAKRGEEWSAREIRDHVAQSQVMWLSRLDAITDGSFRVHDALDTMVRERIATLDATATREREVLGGRWSARRVIRRLMEHQLEHLQQIKDALREVTHR